MHIDDASGHVILGHENCHGCQFSERPGQRKIPGKCQPCKGTGNGPRGGRNGCRKCYGSGNDHANPAGWETCPSCNGNPTDVEREGPTDHIPKEWASRFRFHVVRTDRAMTWGESYLGAGFCSVTDYGDAAKTPDDQLAAKVAETFGGSHQLCKFARPTRDVPRVDYETTRHLPADERAAIYEANALERWAVPQEVTWDVAILVRRNGYSLLPLWPEDAAALGIDTTKELATA